MTRRSTIDPARVGGGGSPAKRRARAIESFRCAAEDLGPVDFGTSLFCVTRGQWSMIDAVLHVLDCCDGPCDLSVWTWTVAEYEIEVMERLMADRRIGHGLLVIDHAARSKNASLIARWKRSFGSATVRYVVNHAKIATIADAAGRRFLLRGSMNLNFNPRFEQFDLTEGGEDYALVKRIEADLPTLDDDATVPEVYAASQVSSAFTAEQLAIFGQGGLKRWAK